MKKIYLLILMSFCLCSLCAYAESPCDKEMPMKPKSECVKPCEKPSCKSCLKKAPAQNELKCPQNYTSSEECFLCTGKNIKEVFKNASLSETQICNAMKIQEKYNTEVLSLNEKITCEEEKLSKLKKNCSSKSELRKQKKLLKDLNKKKKEICNCYENQFKALLSDSQKKSYNKFKRAK
jgi:hypothetical protein